MNNLKEILLEFKDRNYQNFDLFYQETNKLVYYIIAPMINNEMIIEDLMQDTYIKFLENIDGVDIYHSPKAYLAQISKNLSINHLKKSSRIELNEDYFKTILEPKKESNIDLGIIDLLEGIDKEIVSMHIIGDMKFKDIAYALDIPLGTALWRYNKAIKELRKKVN